MGWTWTPTVSLKYKVAVKVLNLVLALIQKKLNLTRCTFLHFGKTFPDNTNLIKNT